MFIKLFRQAINSKATKYFFIGGVCASFDLLVFIAFTAAGLDPITSTVIGYCAGTLLSFTLNRSLTFAVLDKTIKRLALFFVTGILGLSLSALLMYLGQTYTTISPEILKVISIPPVAVFQYLVNKKLTFK